MSVNKVILIGNVGKDPEVRTLDNNTKVANFSLATSERGYTLGNGTIVPDRTEWHTIVVWRAQAEFVEKYVRKSSTLYIEGKLRTRNYEDKTGVKRYVTEVFADSIQFVGARRDDSNRNNETTINNAQTATADPQPVIKTETFESAPSTAADTADDLPF